MRSAQSDPIVARIADAVQEGIALRKETMPAEAAEAEGALEADDPCLSEGTLADLRAGLDSQEALTLRRSRSSRRINRIRPQWTCGR